MAAQNTVRLEDKELEHVRALTREVDAKLREIHEITMGHVRGEKGKYRPKEARFVFDNIRIIMEGDGTCGVYEDPPGICRPCTLEETIVNDR
ncbi:hypothetical protein AR457_35405 [Streptomyces agglomeratus]|uniref:hypothetical protein n=1 Tax=Streptomyces agglomeratus TaxID=285458 RepID=UPI0008525096|nr:hypothetical protein [Streptomyces agglomeratus]OEJ37248.1 hypothetical protein BGK70_02895 [Streptomyces agglomeratus]OEJ48373.1 hypothetical protein AR457_33780 [Streptomyces agglomeratus]OEJ48600.1 hypothetical protein AR457_35405 [Streptomyces agglomeratus]OEJ57109.1 hypothetical protein BGM19_03005 [Streptomyces agglomeratus]